MYGASPTGFGLCCRIAFLGALGPKGITGSWLAGGAEGGVAGCMLVCPGEEENFEDMLDNHEFRLVVGEGVPALGMLPFVTPFSIEELELVLVKPGLCAVIGLGGVGIGSAGSWLWPWPFCVGLDVFSGGDVAMGRDLCESRCRILSLVSLLHSGVAIVFHSILTAISELPLH